MPKSFTPKQIIRVLVRHGFVLKRIKGSHHIFQHSTSKRRAIVPLHQRDLPKGTLNEILKDAWLPINDL
jgi:predicted RNA binding protein YcfA (HicA-like mRNA interferase family)